MKIGSIVRKTLGPKVFNYISPLYRGFFCDLSKVASAMAPHIPKNAHVLDIGAGDGDLINFLSALRPDLRFTLLDIKEDIGGALKERYRSSVTLVSGHLHSFIQRNTEAFQAVLIVDVMHHVLPEEIPSFFNVLDELMRKNPDLKILVKEAEPEGIRTKISVLADRYITGDPHVRLISKEELTRVFNHYLSQPIQTRPTDLYETDGPNYAVCFSSLYSPL